MKGCFERISFYICRLVVLYRWKFDIKRGIDVKTCFNFSWLMFRLVSNMAKSQSYAQGLGRFSEEEVQHVMEEYLQALSKFLGNSK